ncbi:pilus assembly protein Flp/PilA [Micromonospora pattaloongensis]|uniref:Pilus assembly protein Flp/PilA n=1 Tax=Micromonospora pattaloongensis TaxID=405436 RepID=A0A1H3NPT4_9ACTN|nr:Flp family type IVb pilin [Micromonospora pattaloongensis]SDY90921.1 pilus assembly protein Flp/PilA [Micromonospora pattaloongensis]
MLTYFSSHLTSFVNALRERADRGATAVEYGLMVALIAVVIIAAVMLLGDNLSGMFSGVADEVGATTPTTGP